MFKAIGTVFSKTATVKAIPFGVGVLVGGAMGYGMTRYVGNIARSFFLLETDVVAA